MQISLRAVAFLAVAVIGSGCDSSTSPRPGFQYELVSSTGHFDTLEEGSVFFLSGDRIIHHRVYATDAGPQEHGLDGRYRIVRDSVLEVTWVQPAVWIHWGVFRGETLELQLVGPADGAIRETYTRRR